MVRCMLNRADRKRRREINRLRRDLYRRGSLSIQMNAMEKLRDLDEIAVITAWLTSGQLGAYKDTYYEAAARMLAKIDDPSAVDELLVVLSRTGSYRVAAELCKVGDERAIDLLRTWAVNNRHSPLALEVIGGLGRIGGRRASNALVALLAMPPRNVSDRARWELKILRMLGDAGDESAVETLIAWTTRDRDVMACTVAVDSIGRIGGPVAAEALRVMRDDQSIRNALGAVRLRRVEPDRTLATRALEWLTSDSMPEQ